MSTSKRVRGKAHREYTQLLHLNQRVMLQLQEIADDLEAPGTTSLLREIRRRTGDSEDTIAEVASAVEEAIRILKLWESELRLGLATHPNAIELEGVTNLPATLARFLAERKQFPGFTYEVTQDEVRGWVIHWKEMTTHGTVRGAGQFYERPYAWLDD